MAHWKHYLRHGESAIHSAGYPAPIYKFLRTAQQFDAGDAVSGLSGSPKQVEDEENER